jgi:1-acyl-sn-glycerol-3-phosphate acyltransferase
MLDIARLERIHLKPVPIGQVVLGNLGLKPNYEWFRHVDIELEHLDRLPDSPIILAMNHTDRYNYWPFQYAMWKRLDRFTATWVKGKYYESAMLGKFMELTGNLPTVSRGYLIARDFLSVMDRQPSGEEYAMLRSWVEGGSRAAAGDPPAEVAKRISKDVLQRPRNVLGYAFYPSQESYAAYINGIFACMMSRFVELNRQALGIGLDLLIFPQGTRSIRLPRGHIGLAQIALAFETTIVPVGCSGSDLVYPGSSPFAQSGSITYRIGEPITYEDMREFHVAEEFVPFSQEAESAHRERFQGLVDVVMDRINDLVEPRYQYSEDLESEGVSGSNRFL